MIGDSSVWKRLYLGKARFGEGLICTRLDLEQAVFGKGMYLYIGQQVHKELMGILLSATCPVLLLQSIDTLA